MSETMGRSLSSSERALLVSTLELMRTGDHDPFTGTDAFDKWGNSVHIPKAQPEDPEPYLAQIEALRVVGQCGCGQESCDTIYFATERGWGSSNSPSKVAMANTDDGRLAIVFAREGALVELEVIG